MKRRQFLQSTAGALTGFHLLSHFSHAEEESDKRPNILFCIADDASYPHMGAYGCPWINTPAFDRVAREGILFTRAYTPNAKCAPSRACILTGRNTWQLEEACNHWCFFPEKFKTYPETLTGHGYHVGYTGKGWAPGIPGTIDGKPRQLVGAPYQKRKMEAPTRSISSRDYAGNFELFLNDKPDDQPFCFWYGGHEPHRSYEYGSGIHKGNKNIDEIDRVFPIWPDNDTVRTDLLDYAFEIEYFDKHLQRMLAMLEARGELENTLVIVTADNGMPFPRIKGQEYEYSNHLPLAIMWPKGIKNPGRVVDDYVNFIDFAPTYLELAQVKPEECGMEPITGRSLTDVFKNGKSGIVNPERDHVLIGKERHDVGRPDDVGYPIRGIVKGGYLYLHNFEPERWPVGNPETGYTNTDGSPTKTEALNTLHDSRPRKYWEMNFGKRTQEELYDIRVDTDCINNLANNPNYQALKEELKNQLFAELKVQNDPRMYGKGYIFDEYPYADEKWKGYYEKQMKREAPTPGWISPSDFDHRMD